MIAGLVMTYIGAGLLTLGGLGLLIAAANGEVSSGFVSGFAAGLGVSKGSSMVVIVAVAFMVLVFSAILILPAVLAHKGSSGGRTALTVIGGLRLALDVFTLVTQGNVKVVPSMVWIAVAVGLLWTWQANAWFRYKAHVRDQGR